jgi:hypothetical protein
LFRQNKKDTELSHLPLHRHMLLCQFPIVASRSVDLRAAIIIGKISSTHIAPSARINGSMSVQCWSDVQQQREVEEGATTSIGRRDARRALEKNLDYFLFSVLINIKNITHGCISCTRLIRWMEMVKIHYDFRNIKSPKLNPLFASCSKIMDWTLIFKCGQPCNFQIFGSFIMFVF